MAARLDELRLVKPRPLLAPSVAAGGLRQRVDQPRPGIAFVAVPADDNAAVVEVHRTRLSVEPQALPVPQLEGPQAKARQ